MSEPTPVQDAAQAQEIAATTIAEYDRMAAAYRRGTADHDVSQNIAALLEAIEGAAPHVILDRLRARPGSPPVHRARPRGGRPGRIGRTRRHGARQDGL